MQITAHQPRHTTTLTDRTPLLRYMGLLNGSNQPTSRTEHNPLGALRAGTSRAAVPPIFQRAETRAAEPDDELELLSACATR